MIEYIGNNESLVFTKVEPYLGWGFPVPPGWQPITSLPMLVIVGGVGSGKSTTVKALIAAGCGFRLLPNRRDMTDKLIVAPLQQEDRLPIITLDRTQRLPYIRRYKERFPAGLAYALSRLYIDLERCDKLLVFDGFRGEDEVIYAIQTFHLAFFVFLYAPNIVRVRRLIDRDDKYDQLATNFRDRNPWYLEGSSSGFSSIGIPEASSLFSTDEEQSLMLLLREKKIRPKELREKLRIICDERSLYDLDATMNLLAKVAPQRAIIINTNQYAPDQVVDMVRMGASAVVNPCYGS